MKLGTIAAVPSAVMKPHSVPVEVTKVEILTGTVRMLVVRCSDSRNSVQREDEAQHRRRREAALDQRQHDHAEDREARGAVDHRRLVELARHVVEEALHQQHRERQVDQRMRQDQAEIACRAGPRSRNMKNSGTATAIGGIMRCDRTQKTRCCLPRNSQRDRA